MLLSAICAGVLTFSVLDIRWGTEDEKAGLRGTASEQAPNTQSKDAASTAIAVEEPEEDDVEIPEDMPENAIFIPLSFPRQLPRTFYKGTDPEWQSFIAFAKDKNRSLLIRSMSFSNEFPELSLSDGTDDLAGMIGQHLGNMKSFQKHLGQSIQPRKYWLDVDFPDGPPPEYERSGYVAFLPASKVF